MNVNVPQSGGTELEGEYFLAKPNGRYWKFTFMPEGHRLRLEDFSSEQVAVMGRVYEFLFTTQCVYGAAVSTEDASLWDTLAQLDGIYNIGARMTLAIKAIQDYQNGYEYSHYDFNAGFLRVWKECDVKSNPRIEYMGISLDTWNLIEAMKELGRLQGMEITDDEAIPLIEQVFMITPATEEEYKYWRIED